MSALKKALFFTNSEYGQSNIILAVAAELVRHGGFEVHIASYAPISSRIAHLRSYLPKDLRPALIFHELPGKSMTEAVDQAGIRDLPHRPGLLGGVIGARAFPKMFAFWDDPPYLERAENCKEILQNVKPVVVVIDPLFGPAMDACKIIGCDYIILSPLGLRDTVTPMQPWLGILWKYPAIASGYIFPLPWYRIPENIVVLVSVAFAVVFSARFLRIMKARWKYGLKGYLPSLVGCTNGVKLLCPALLEADYPLQVPSNVTCCGPILLEAPPLAESDPEMETWLKSRRTIYINLGSHVVTEDADAIEIARALDLLLDKHSDIQILWKLKHVQPLDTKSTRNLEVALSNGRVRIQTWLQSDPTAMLKSGHIACSVHHGGANSFYEAVACGIPQVIVPKWLDTYATATCAEYLGIGVYGNKKGAPHINGDELGNALNTVIGDGSERSRAIIQRAHDLGMICRRTEGRKVACAEIVKFAEAQQLLN